MMGSIVSLSLPFTFVRMASGSGIDCSQPERLTEKDGEEKTESEWNKQATASSTQPSGKSDGYQWIHMESPCETD